MCQNLIKTRTIDYIDKINTAKLPTGEEIKITFDQYNNQGLISKSHQQFTGLLDTPGFLQALTVPGQQQRSQEPRLCEVLL